MNQSMVTCPKCGAYILPSSTSCPNCGFQFIDFRYVDQSALAYQVHPTDYFSLKKSAYTKFIIPIFVSLISFVMTILAFFLPVFNFIYVYNYNPFYGFSAVYEADLGCVGFANYSIDRDHAYQPNRDVASQITTVVTIFLIIFILSLFGVTLLSFTKHYGRMIFLSVVNISLLFIMSGIVRLFFRGKLITSDSLISLNQHYSVGFWILLIMSLVIFILALVNRYIRKKHNESVVDVV